MAGAAALKAFKTGIELAIPHEMSTSDWAETYRGVDRGARPGKWSNSVTPYLVGIMDAADDPFVREIVFQKSSQIGGSEVLNNIIGKRIHQAPTQIIYCAENQDKAAAWTVESFDAMVRVTPELKRLIGTSSEDDNQKVKRFPGGGLYIVWASSPAPLSSRPVQILCFDEKAAYKPTSEGDPVKLGQARQKTYDGEDLTIFISTPRRCDCSADETCGDISHDFERGDQREYYVPCPHCDEFQTLKFGGKETSYGLKWDKDAPESPYYLCEHCAAIIEEFDKEDMLAKGYWRAAKEFNRVASFKLNQLYSPFVSWGSMVTDFLGATSKAKLEVLTNTVFGDVWKPVERIEYEGLILNFETYQTQVPAGVLVLTAGVDIQKDRIECFDDKTELLTSDGWQYFSDLSANNRMPTVATVNLATDQIEYQMPTALIEREHSGSMVKITTGSSNIAVTPNHRMLVFKSERDIRANQPQIVLAGDMRTSHRLKAVSHWAGESMDEIVLPTSYFDLGNGNLHERRGKVRLRYQIAGVRTEKHFDTREEARSYFEPIKGSVAVNEPQKFLDAKDFARFLGWFVSEGHTSFHQDYRVYITQNEGPNFDEICAVVDRLGFARSVHAKEKKRVLKISSKQLYHYLREHCGIGAANKKVPAFIKKATPDIIEEFIDAFNKGDGWIQGRLDDSRKSLRYFGTCSRQLADDLQELLIKLGKRSNISFKSSKNPRWRDFYYISELTSRHIHVTKRNLSETYYKGWVYCVSVPNSTLICRREGKMFIAGNCEIVGWGRNHESWSIDYRVFMGDTGVELTDGEDDSDEPLSSVWDALAEFLQQPFEGIDGQSFRVQCVGVDSGYLATRVYKFCKKYAAKRWYAVKGASDPFKPLLSKPTMTGRNPKVRLFTIGTNAAKDEVFSALRVEKRGPNFCHFPDREPYDEAYLKQLCSERMVTHTRGGQTYRVYEKVGAGVRNEALDIRCYAIAARAILNPNYEAIARRRLTHAEVADRPEETVDAETPQPETTKPPENVVPFTANRTKNNPYANYDPFNY